MKQVLTHNLKAELLGKLSQAEHRIRIAVAWLTYADVLQVLIRRAFKGLDVEVVISDHPYNFKEAYSLDFNPLKKAGGKVYVWKQNFFHSKFSIIDDDCLFIGSANYTYNGFYKNREMTLMVDDPALIAEFIKDFEDITRFFREENGLIISPLKFFYEKEIRLLYESNNWLEAEISEAEKTIRQYEIVYRLRFLDVIQEILYLQKLLAERRHTLIEKPETQKAKHVAKKAWEDFRSTTLSDTKEKNELENESLRTSLKNLYREAAKLCHPDSPEIIDDKKEVASQIFHAVKTAYDQNDESALRSLLEDLQSGLLFGTFDIDSKSQEELEVLYQKQKAKNDNLLAQLASLQEDPRYLVMQEDDSEPHFKEKEVILREELRILRGTCGV